MDDKVLLKYYRLEKDFEDSIELEGTAERLRSITDESGRQEKKKESLTVQVPDPFKEKFKNYFNKKKPTVREVPWDVGFFLLKHTILLRRLQFL